VVNATDAVLLNDVRKVCNLFFSRTSCLIYAIYLRLDKIQDYKRNWIQHVNRMPCNRLPRLIKELCPKRQKEPRKTTEETFGCMRPEWVNKCPNFLIPTS
jgi:hypothetical protein